jgi:hypothetical protein
MLGYQDSNQEQLMRTGLPLSEARHPQVPHIDAEVGALIAPITACSYGLSLAGSETLWHPKWHPHVWPSPRAFPRELTMPTSNSEPYGLRLARFGGRLCASPSWALDDRNFLRDECPRSPQRGRNFAGQARIGSILRAPTVRVLLLVISVHPGNAGTEYADRCFSLVATGTSRAFARVGAVEA